MGKQHKIFLSLGSNLGDREKHLQAALVLLAQELGSIVQQSRLYETEAWGVKDQAPFLNMVVMLETEKSPRESIDLCLSIEASLGRQREGKWEARSIDIDILFYDDQIIHEKNLEIPHPRLHLRNFVLIPLMEIAGDWIHPVLLQDIESLYLASGDPLEVILIE